jgi:hypothetical protein
LRLHFVKRAPTAFFLLPEVTVTKVCPYRLGFFDSPYN